MAEDPEEPFDVRPTKRWGVFIFVCATAVVAWALYSAWLFTQQRELIAEQKRLQRVLVERSLPVFDALRPTAVDLRDSRSGLAGGLRRADGLLRDSRPLVRELRPLVADLGPLVRDTQPLVNEAQPLVRDLRSVDLSGILRASGEAAEQAAAGNRTARSLDATIALLDELRRRDLPRRLGVLSDRAERDLPRLIGLQAEALSILRRTLAVQEEALVHIRSIDRKTGGPAPGTPTTAAPPSG